MSFSSQTLLLDTNVWINHFLARGDQGRVAQDFVETALSQGYDLAYPVHVIKDVFYIITQTLKEDARVRDGELTQSAALAARATAWACVENMLENATAIGADQSDAWLACKYRAITSDLEDNFVLAAAERAVSVVLITSDEALLKKATVEAHTPEDALALMRM